VIQPEICFVPINSHIDIRVAELNAENYWVRRNMQQQQLLLLRAGTDLQIADIGYSRLLFRVSARFSRWTCAYVNILIDSCCPEVLLVSYEVDDKYQHGSEVTSL
jgi:hypothetical protein